MGVGTTTTRPDVASTPTSSWTGTRPPAGRAPATADTRAGDVRDGGTRAPGGADGARAAGGPVHGGGRGGGARRPDVAGPPDPMAVPQGEPVQGVVLGGHDDDVTDHERLGLHDPVERGG